MTYNPFALDMAKVLGFAHANRDLSVDLEWVQPGPWDREHCWKCELA